jgi:DNA-binding NtrC family response regulator
MPFALHEGYMKVNLSKQKKTILVVEDDKEVLDLLSQILSGMGYAPMKAGSGGQALRIAPRMRPDLVILDLNLPDCNGMEVLHQLKAMDEAIQVIILTGYGSREAVRRAMEIGAFDFLTKPFEVHEICSVVQEALISASPGVSTENHHA